MKDEQQVMERNAMDQIAREWDLQYQVDKEKG